MRVRGKKTLAYNIFITTIAFSYICRVYFIEFCFVRISVFPLLPHVRFYLWNITHFLVAASTAWFMLIDTSCHAFGLPLAVLLLSFPSCPCGDRPALDPGSDSALRSFVSSFFCNSFHRIPLQPSLRFKVRCCSCSSTTLFLSCMFENFFPKQSVHCWCLIYMLFCDLVMCLEC